ncbi:MAG TPA: hypothetical protein VFV41_13290 [Streptosporangiaceae bacterium]|nr:hypothetical protein [Streptosporangiaceae bacterium]
MPQPSAPASRGVRPISTPLATTRLVPDQSGQDLAGQPQVGPHSAA